MTLHIEVKRDNPAGERVPTAGARDRDPLVFTVRSSIKILS